MCKKNIGSIINPNAHIFLNQIKEDIKTLREIQGSCKGPMETLPVLEEKHEVSKKALNTLEKVMFSQDDYGLDKYQKPLKHTYQYDWLQMFLEEMADGLKYIQNEMDRKQSVIEILECSLEMNVPKEGVIRALKLLKMEGTGK
jgi:hypothetical protein